MGTNTIIRCFVGWLITLATSCGLQAAPQEVAPAAVTSAAPAARIKTFEVASVRANRSGTTQVRNERTPEGVTIINMPLRAISQLAYGVSQPSRLADVPVWTNVERFDIVARGANSGIDDFRAMMQALLADRFGLAVHTEQRSVRILNLVLARRDGRLGPSLKRSDVECPNTLGGRGRGAAAPTTSAVPSACGQSATGPGEIKLIGVSIEALVAFLSLSQQQPVVDRTGLAGTYDFHLLFLPTPFPGRDPQPGTEGRVEIFTAIQEQLGLKLEGASQPQDVLVIDRVSRPDDN
jgi:uncharacterized protein (TIGR03435 family)